MPGNAVDAASFEFYEGIRIVIPGALAGGLLAGIGRTFDLPFLSLTEGPLVAVVGSLLLGMFLYFLDFPKKAAIFNTLQPTDHIIYNWCADKPKRMTTINAYFLILDTRAPAAVRARALYMGSMFRIGYESIYMLLAASIVCLSEPLWNFRAEITSTRSVTHLVTALVVAGVLLYSWVGLRKSQESKRAWTKDHADLEPVATNQRDIVWLGASALAWLIVLILPVSTLAKLIPIGVLLVR